MQGAASGAKSIPKLFPYAALYNSHHVRFSVVPTLINWIFRQQTLADEKGITRAIQLAQAALDKTRAKGTTYADMQRYADGGK